MKKAISFVLMICMILSICTFTISADPVGTAITNEAEFLAMKENGTYYLANDITVTKSYDKFFTGNFDGNGKTVTVSEPMFLEFCGQAKNLTINGEIVADHAKDNGYWARGAFACMVSGDGTIVLHNITNNANVTGFTEQDGVTYPGLLGESYTGGIIGALDNKSVGTTASIAITECVNNGNVKGYHCTGGITGILYVNDSDYSGDQTATVINCTNNGSIEGLSTYTGGIVGRVYYVVDATFTGCTNNGVVKGAGNTGGLIGHTTNTSSIIRVCQNNGAVSNIDTEGGTPYAGGIIGYAQGTKEASFSAANDMYASHIEFCINTGDVTGACRSGGIVASSGAKGAFGRTLTRYCINTGNVTCRGLGTSLAANAAGGIQGYAYGGSAEDQYAYVTNCINTGYIEAQHAELGIASYFLGYTSSPFAMIANNSSTGSLYAISGNTFALGWNNKYTYAEGTTGNNLLATNLHKLAAENEVESERDFGTGVVDETALLDGTTIAEINAAYKTIAESTADAFAMNINGTFNPNIVILKTEEPIFPEPAPEPEVTEPEATEPEATEPEATEPEATEPEATQGGDEQTNAPEQQTPNATEPAPEKKGCGGFVAGGAFIVAILGTALVIKKKND